MSEEILREIKRAIHIMIKGLIHYEDIIAFNMYTPDNRASKQMNQKGQKSK